jgi:hypothetical protein
MANAGQIASLQSTDSSVCSTPMLWRVSLEREPLTGEPDAGNPPVRFGGRGNATAFSLPLSKSRKVRRPQRHTGVCLLVRL